MSRLELMVEPNVTPVRRVEVVTGASGRRRWAADEKARVVEETLQPDAVVSEIARRHGLTPQQLFSWRRTMRLRSPSGDRAEWPASCCTSFRDPPASVIFLAQLVMAVRRPE